MTEEKIGCGQEFKKYWNSKVVYLCGQMYLGEIILCPSCKEKKDNHSQQTKLRRENGNLKYRDSILDTTEDKTADEEPELDIVQERSSSSSGSDIQSPKIFEDIIWLIEEIDGKNCDKWNCDMCVLKSKIKEKWGKIER
jgi:hypothetical protein